VPKADWLAYPNPKAQVYQKPEPVTERLDCDFDYGAHSVVGGCGLALPRYSNYWAWSGEDPA
jgi:hypothetical protein